MSKVIVKFIEQPYRDKYLGKKAHRNYYTKSVDDINDARIFENETGAKIAIPHWAKNIKYKLIPIDLSRCVEE